MLFEWWCDLDDLDDLIGEEMVSMPVNQSVKIDDFSKAVIS